MTFIKVEVDKVTNSCFVVMPFNSLFQTEYDKIIQPALEEIGVQCIRGDEIYVKQRIVDDIWLQIRRCRFVLAELTSKNPNVLYEIGLAHAIGKPIIIITRNEDDVPFDLKSLRYLFYNVNDPFWGDNLKIGIQKLAQKVIDNPAIEKYLEGIELPKIKYPDIKKGKDKTEKVKKVLFDISGTWFGAFIDDLNLTHQVVLQLKQNNDELFGSAVITYSINDDEVVVQQIMNGVISEENMISINGVNYTFIKSADPEGYALDNFELKFNQEKATLEGKVISQDTTVNVDLNTTILLKKQ